MNKFTHWSGCTAFQDKTIGSKVVLEHVFYGFLREAVANHDTSKDRAPGQHFIVLPEKAFETVSGGVGPQSDNPEDFVLRAHRGRVNAYLKRENAQPVESLAVVVYTTEAFLADPDIDEEENARITESGATHVVVAVLAGAGPEPALSPYRLVHNLAGGNNEVKDWTLEDIVSKAKASKSYDDAWCVVAD